MRNSLISILVAFLAAGAALAQDGKAVVRDSVALPAFSHLTPADGLPYPVVLGLAQDRRGFIWAATPGGAVRWDGYRMMVFRHDDADAASLPENIVSSAIADERGRIWLSTVSGVVVRHDDATGGFVAYRDRGDSFGRLHGMAADGRGGIWIAGRQGLARLDVDTKIWRRETGIPAGEAGSVLVDRSGRVWAGTAEGLMWRAADGGAFVPVSMASNMVGDIASALFEDGDGRVWFGTRKGRVGRVTIDGGKAAAELALPPSGHRVTTLIEARPGVIWAGEYGGGIRELNYRSGALRQFSHDPVVRSSLGDNTVTGLLVDKSGLIWASSLRGLHRHIPDNQRLVTIIPQGRGGLPGGDVRSVTAAADGKAWLGFRAEGVALVDSAAKVVKVLAPGRRLADLPDGAVQALADTSDGNLWVGLTGGLFQVDVATGRATPYVPLAGANIMVLRQDGGNLWAGGSMGLAQIPLDGSPPRFYRFDRNNPNSLSDNSVQAVFRDHAKRLWIGTQRGLNLLEEPERGIFRRFLNEPGARNSLPSDIVNSLAEDRSGRLWLATANGVGILELEAGGKARFARVTTANGLPSDTVLSVLEGASEQIIAGTGDGLSVIDPQTLAVRTFGPAEGLQIKTFWAGSAAKTSDGARILGGFGGMALIRPTLPPSWEFQPPVTATEIRVGGRIWPQLDEVVVGPEDGGFQVDFAALDFSAPERIHYTYRLFGNDENWTVTDSHHRTAGYTNLSPGRYRLEVRGTNSVGAWSDKSLTLGVRVLPAWYQTGWFRLLAGLVIFMVVVGLLRARKTYYVRREQELTRQVAAKTAEAEAAKEAAESADRMKSRFLAIIGHEIRTPLNGLLGMLQLLGPHVPEKGQHKLLLTAKETGETLRHLVESILEYGREGATPAEIVLGDVDLCHLAEATLDLIRPQATAKGLTLTLCIEPPGPLWIRCDHTKLSRILLNLLSNAIKFTEAGSISVVMSVVTDATGNRLRVSVADTGIGIAPEMQDAIFGDFVQADDSITRKFGGVGLGLAISRRMAARMGGTLSVESAIGTGSTFLLDVAVAPGSPVTTGEAEPLGSGGPGLRVLVVDDDEINRRVAESFLARLGHRPSTVACGEDAIEAVSAADFDVILMDLRMPGMDGIEAARRIRQVKAGQKTPLRIMAMTADLTEETWRQCAAAGMDTGLAKPVQLEKLRATLAVTASSTPLHSPLDASLDLEFLAMQLDILGPLEMVRLTRLFQRTSRRMIAAMDAAAAVLDRSTLAAQAHRLRSAAGPLGLVDVGNWAARIEAAAPRDAQAHLQDLLASLRKARLSALKALARIAADHRESMDIPNR